MLFRAIALSLALLIGIGAVIPLVTDHAEAGSFKKKKKKKRVKYKKYSKKWWRAYRQSKDRQTILAKRKRAMRVRQLLLARENDIQQVTEVSQKSKTKTDKNSIVESVPALLPSGEPAPKGWRSNLVSNSELQYRVDDDNGAQIGSAAIAVVGPAMNAEGTSAAKNKTVGGVPTISLRSTVIDRMIKEQGWVVNDYQKEIGGKKVYVVVAQSPGAGGAIQSRIFYFTEADGRIYSVSTSSPNGSTERLSQESEKVIDSLQRRRSDPQQALNK